MSGSSDVVRKKEVPEDSQPDLGALNESASGVESSAINKSGVEGEPEKSEPGLGTPEVSGLGAVPNVVIKSEDKEEPEKSQPNFPTSIAHDSGGVSPTINTGGVKQEPEPTSGGSSLGRKVITLNPIAMSGLFKPPTKPATSPGAASSNSDASIKTETTTIPVQTKSDFFKLTQALATALKSDPRKKVFCANTNCNTKTDTVFEAPSYARLYFGMPSKSAPKICANCMRKAELFHQKSKKLVTNKENLFDLTVEIQTASSEVMVDLDSPVNSPQDGAVLSEGTSNDSSSNAPMYSISEKKFDDILQKTLEKFDLQLQVDKCTKHLSTEVDELESHFNAMDLQMRRLRDQIDATARTYNEEVVGKPKTVEIGCVNIDSRGAITVRKGNIREEGLTRTASKILKKAMDDLNSIVDAGGMPEIQMGASAGTGLVNSRGRQLIFVKPKSGQEVYAMHKHSLCYWLPARILKVSQSTYVHRPTNMVLPTVYTVQFQQKVKARTRSSDEVDAYIKDVTGRMIAFKKPSTVTLPVGCRIIAKFKDLLQTDTDVDGMLYAGIVAEAPKVINKFRYLVFFDDGYAQYVLPQEVYPVVEASPDVWLDVHKNSQDFVRDYVTKYPDRHMIRADIGSIFNVELNGQWLLARTAQMDGSLIKVQYLKKTDGIEFEWIYRGSTRLGPLFTRLNTMLAKPGLNIARRHTYNRRPANFSFEVNRDLEEGAVVKKHTGHDESRQAKPFLRAKDGRLISTALESQGNMIKIQIPVSCPSPRPYSSHICSGECAYRYEEDNYRKVSPLAIPFYLGWARELAGVGRDKVYYHSPCGVRCGSYKEIHAYITRTGAEIPIDFFSMESNIDCLNEFEPSRKIESLKDISYGKEWTPVPCVNSLDHDLPSYMEYITTRLPGKGVSICDDEGSLVCCDCVDDCQDKDKCACWQLTLSGLSFKIAKKEGYKLAGYENRRLKEQVHTAIYECNQRCKCRSTCFNRVVQNKVKWPVQIFKTVAKGWGVRALHDMPQGSFICVYTGQLLTDATANEEGREMGDEFLAELDFIECCEQTKEEYESDVTDIESEESGTRSNARKAKAIESGNSNEPKKQEVAKKSTAAPLHKAVKSTGGSKRNPETETSKEASSNLSANRPVARKSGSKNGIAHKDGKNKSSSDSVVPPPASSISKRSSKDDSDSDNDDDVKAYSSFSASAITKGTEKLSLREYFGKDETVYIMDAKSMGNFGRYLNHSCDPNVLVQNLFVDTHDPRFPWVAFFTKKDVKAGTELTWDYHYEMGSVPGKTLYCYCLQQGCRGRLL